MTSREDSKLPRDEPGKGPVGVSRDVPVELPGKASIGEDDGCGAAPVPRLEGLTDAADTLRLKLHGQKVGCADDLWARVGLDSDTGIADLSEAAGVPHAELLDLLARQAKWEFEKRGGKKPARFIRAVKRHWLDVAVVLAALSILLLFLRATGVLSPLPYPIGLSGCVLVTARQLEPGRVLGEGDLTAARLPREYYHFDETADVRGLVLAQGLKLGEPLRHEHLMRLQVVAAKDLPADTILSCHDFGYAWTPYHADAALDYGPLVEGRLNRALAKGQVVEPKFVAAKGRR